MKSIKNILAILGLVLVFSSCSQDEILAEDYITFDVNNANIEISPDGSGVAKVTVFSSRKVSGDLMLNINVVEEETSLDASQYQLSQSVVIPSGTNKGEFEITFNGVQLGNNPVITLAFEETDGLSFSDNATFNIIEACSGLESFLLITFDDYSEETSWEIYRDGENTPILSNSYASGQESVSERLCFSPGSYLFIIYDAFGDGICCDWGEGSFQLILGDGTLVAEGGEFGESESFEFVVSE